MPAPPSSKQTAAKNAIQLIASPDNLTSGTMRVYGKV